MSRRIGIYCPRMIVWYPDDADYYDVCSLCYVQKDCDRNCIKCTLCPLNPNKQKN